MQKGSGYSMSLLLVSCLSLVEVVPVWAPTCGFYDASRCCLLTASGPMASHVSQLSDLLPCCSPTAGCDAGQLRTVVEVLLL